tara:strand:- start:4384 stop:4953 length:570 start_codon:yes stop_codon:yes gene_type:complete
MKTTKSVYETLSAINVNSKIEKKNGLTYLSWAWAWAEVKNNYPQASYTIYENSDGFNYHHDNQTAWVKTGVMIEDIEHIEYLPVLDFRNKSIPIANITSFNVNSSIQRSLTKAIARHGLGLYIYAGEDLPEEEVVEVKVIPLNIDDENWVKIMKFVGANKSKGLKSIIKTLNTKYTISKLVEKEISKSL